MHIRQGTICYGFSPLFSPSTSVVYIVLLSLKIEEHCLNVLCLMGRMCWCWRKSWPTWVVCVLLHSWGETSLCLQVRFLPHALLLTHSLTHAFTLSQCIYVYISLSLPLNPPPPPPFSIISSWLCVVAYGGCLWALWGLRIVRVEGNVVITHDKCWLMLTGNYLLSNYCK